MRTFQDLVSDYKILSRDNSSANETLGQILINQFTNRILALGNWTTNRGSHSDISIGGQNNYPLPYNAGKVTGVKILVDDVPYWPSEISDRGTWEVISRSTTESDYIQYYFVDPATHEMLLYPHFSGSAHDITTYYNKVITSRSASDYRTGTASRSAAARTVNGTGTTFTWDMVGRYIKFEDDPYWDEIDAFYSTTKITTRRESRTATDDGDYRISEIIPLPYGFEDLPVWAALEIYFQQKENSNQANHYGRLYREGLNDLTRTDSKTTGNVLEKGPTQQDTVDVNRYPLSMA